MLEFAFSKQMSTCGPGQILQVARVSKNRVKLKLRVFGAVWEAMDRIHLLEKGWVSRCFYSEDIQD